MTQLSRESIRRLATSTGKSTAAKALQRIDEQVANFEAKNPVEAGDADLFRIYALKALRAEINIVIGADRQLHLDSPDQLFEVIAVEFTGASVRIRYAHAGYAPVIRAFIPDYPWLTTTLERYWNEKDKQGLGTLVGQKFKLHGTGPDLADVEWIE